MLRSSSARSRVDRGGIPDSALLAALDDMAVIKPDVVNLSLGRTAGMDSAADTLFAGVYEKLQNNGTIVDVARRQRILGCLWQQVGQEPALRL